MSTDRRREMVHEPSRDSSQLDYSESSGCESRGSNTVKNTFIVWARDQPRSDLLAQHLGGTVHHIQFGQQGKLLPGPAKYLAQALKAPARYVVQSWRTWRDLCEDRPDVIFVQNPPIFCALIAYLYSRRYNARYVIDSHSGAFLSPKWRWSLGLHRALSHRAVLTLVHNKSLEDIVKGWGIRYQVLGFTPGEYPPGEQFPFDGLFNVAVVSSFNVDEPLDVVFEAAAGLPKVNFYVTGDSKRLDGRLLAEKPDNVHLTDFLPYEGYVGLLRGADAVMVLTTQDHTLLMGGIEAVSLGTPLIVSDWPVLRECFSQGTVHVQNTVEGVGEGVGRAQRESAVLQKEILDLRDRLQAEWEEKIAEMQQLLLECS